MGLSEKKRAVESRRYMRKKTEFNLLLTVDGSSYIKAKSINLSKEGMLVSYPYGEFKSGQKIFIEVLLHSALGVKLLSGRIVHCGEVEKMSVKAQYAGIQFHHLTDHARDFIDSCL